MWVDAKDYERKIKELQSLVAAEASRLQNVNDQKDFALREVRQLGERKSRMVAEISRLEEEIGKANAQLLDLKTRESSLIDSAKEELNRLRSQLVVVNRDFSRLSIRAEELKMVCDELDDFIALEKDARQKYLVAQAELGAVEKESKETREMIDKERKKAKERNKLLDDYREKLKEFSGRLTYNLNVFRETVNFLNENLEKRGIPVEFGLPKKIEIPFV